MVDLAETVVHFIIQEWDIFKWIFLMYASSHLGTGIFYIVKGIVWLWLFIIKRGDLK
jgi:hypothetical protein